MRIKTDPQEVWKELENGRNFKSGENLYEIIATNERFKIGDDWKGMKSQNLAPTVYNFIGQVANTVVSSVMSQSITINRNPDELSDDDEQVVIASKVFTKNDKLNWERCKMDAMNEDILMDAFLSGLGGSFWYWDDDIITGNKFLTKGDFVGELLDSVSLYVSNPNEIDIQKQDWIIISVRKTCQAIIEMAKAYGVPVDQIELIQPDETTSYEAYDKARTEQDNNKYQSNQTTLNMKLWKEGKRIMCLKSTSNVFIKKPYDTGLERYPIAIMNWDKRKKFIYGSSPVTPIIANQKVANLQASMRHLHAQLMGIPKVAINKNMVSGFTNTIGGISIVDAQPGVDVGSAIRFIQPTQMTIDVDKSIDDSINRTKDLMGANQSMLGESNPDNFRAILAQQKQAGVPLESVKRRFYQYIEDVALIWMDFYKNKYNLVRMANIEGENEEKFSVEYTGTEFKDIYLQTKVDVGADTQYSEAVQLDTMMNYWNAKIITDPIYMLENTPNDILPNTEKLIKSMQMAQQPEQSHVNMDELYAWLEQQPAEVQQQIMALPEEQQAQALQQMIGGM